MMSNTTFYLVRMVLAFTFYLTATTSSANVNTSATWDTSGKKGVTIQSNRFSNHFSVLMRDTSLSGNRFDYQWHAGHDSNGNLPSNNNLMPAYLIDSSLSVLCDSLLVNTSNNAVVRITSWPKRDMAKLVKHSVRLYIGYIDRSGNLNIVVQLISPKEYKKRNHLYSKELFLVVPRKELHFAIIQFNEEQRHRTTRAFKNDSQVLSFDYKQLSTTGS